MRDLHRYLIIVLAVCCYLLFSPAVQPCQAKGTTSIKVDQSKTSISNQSGTNSKVKKTKAKKKVKKSLAKEPPADLIVSRIWLDHKCRINFKLSNKGKGGLSSDDYGGIRVKLTMGKKSGNFPLKMLDAKKALSNPGGSLSYTTKARIKKPAKVKVEVGKVPDEKVTKNNKKSQTLVPTCGVKAEDEKPVKKPAAPSAKKTKKKTAASQSGSSQSSSGSSSSAIKGSKATAALTLSKLYLKGNQIHVVVRNVGKGRLSPHAAMKGRLKVKSDSHNRTWSLLQLDPTRGKFNRGSKELDYGTGLTLKKSELVKAELLKVPGKGLKKQQRLTPLLSKPVTLSLAKKAKSTEASAKSKVTLKQAQTLKAQKSDKPGLGTKAVSTQASARRVSVARSSSTSIEFRRPNAGLIIFPGSVLDIDYRATAPTSAGETTLRLVSASRGVVATTTHHYTPADLGGEGVEISDPDPVGRGRLDRDSAGPDDSWASLSWSLPARLPQVNDYYITANHQGLYGRSHTFAVGNLDLEITDVYYNDDGVRVEVRSNNMPYNGRVRFRLLSTYLAEAGNYVRELNMDEGGTDTVTLASLAEPNPLACGTRVSVEIDPDNEIPERSEDNNVMERMVYRHARNMQYEGRIFVFRPDTSWLTEVTSHDGLVRWANLGITARDSGRAVRLKVILAPKNCGFRDLGTSRNTTISASGRWDCGGGRLGDCDRSDTTTMGEMVLNLTPGEFRSITTAGVHPRAVPVSVQVNFGGMPGPVNPFRFRIDF